MKNFKLILLILIIPIISFSQNEKVLDEKIRTMMTAMGTTEAFMTALDNMIELQKSAYPEMPNDFWDEFSKEVKGKEIDNLLDLMVPIYQKHYTEKEIDGITEFYVSDVGKSLVQKQSEISTESMQAGAEWGAAIGEIIAKRISETKEKRTETTDCENFKTGSFEGSVLGNPYFIDRNEEYQIEKAKDLIMKFKIVWTSDCSYILLEVDENDEVKATPPINVIIYETNANSYKYQADMNGELMEGEHIMHSRRN